MAFELKLHFSLHRIITRYSYNNIELHNITLPYISHWLKLNCGFQLSKATAMPTAPQPVPISPKLLLTT